MHTSELTKNTYTEPNVVTDAEVVVTDSGNLDEGTYFQDCEISAAALASGELHRRFDTVAFPQKGINYTGDDSDGNAVPAPAVAVPDTSH